MIRKKENMMAKKFLFRGLFGIALLIGVIFICGGILTSRALADCDRPPKSSCISCHAVDGHVTAMGEWNTVHMNQDMCTSCHGGNGNTMDKNMAHADMIAQPLSDIYTDCHSCHPEDYQVRSNQLATTLQITPESCATPTSVAFFTGSGGSYTGNTLISNNNTGGVSTWKSILWITGMLASLVLFILGLSWLNNHHIRS
jgi:hypothetical protein